MNALDHPTAHVMPHPILFNAWKHHFGWVRERIQSVTCDNDLSVLGGEVLILGTRIMDMYIGPLTPAQVGERVLALLQQANRLELPPFREWLETQENYAVIALPQEETRWTLRLGPEDGRFVHLHPGRHSPNTTRIHAPTLKTAVMSVAAAKVRAVPATDVKLVNEMRKKFLDLPPVASIEPTSGIGEVIGMLLEKPQDGRLGA